MKFVTISRRVLLAVVLAAAAAAPAAAAQGAGEKPVVIAPGSPGYEITEEMRHCREMAEIMQAMSVEMSRMQDVMKKGDIPPAARKRMQVKLERMADMMKDMSWLINRPVMNDAERRRKIEAMRKQMAELKHE